MKQLQLPTGPEEPETKPEQYGCSTCKNRQGPIIVMNVVGQPRKVRCFGSLKDPRENCHNWSDGRELEYMIEFSRKGGKEDADG